MIYDPPCGITIVEAIKRALRKARRAKKPLTLKFNGRRYTVRPTSTANDVYFQFERMTGTYRSYFGKPFPKPKRLHPAAQQRSEEK